MQGSDEPRIPQERPREQALSGGVVEIWAALARMRADIVELEARDKALGRAMTELEDRAEILIKDARKEQQRAQGVLREIQRHEAQTRRYEAQTTLKLPIVENGG